MPLRDLSESSDDELLPLEALMPWLYKGTKSPVKPKSGVSAEDSIVVPLKKRQLAKTTKAATSNTGNALKASLLHISAQSTSKKQVFQPEQQTRPDLPTRSSSSLVAPKAAGRKGKGREETTADTLRVANHQSSRESSIVPDSESELDPGTRNSINVGLDAPKLQSRIFGKEWASPPAKEPSTSNITSLLAPPTLIQPKAAPKVVKKDKGRRLTIITILDSDEEAEQQAAKDKEAAVPLTPALSASSSSSSVSQSSEENISDEISFADYSEKEEGDVQSDVANKKTSSTLLELDSSDSDYDGANGVLSWNPSPNKTKQLQPTLRKPLDVTPSRLFDDDRNTAKKVSDSTKRRIIQSDSSEDEDNLPVLATPKPTAKSTDKSKASTSKPAAKAAPAAKSPVKKSSKAAFTKERDAMAQRLIQELDGKVFNGQLPKELTIVWNGRLNTTAGRASWKKITKKPSNTVAFKAEIELSVKVIDSEEKLKCTLAHELCHIAAWAVEGEMKPAHGPAFKTWGRKIMSARKDITVTTKHSYEIAYKYQWQCDSSLCAKIYGRHSKSIDPTKQACGVCAGTLVQLDKEGNKMSGGTKDGTGTPRKESEWSLFSKDAFKRLKVSNPGLSMTQINKLVAEEWQTQKAAKAKSLASTASLADHLESLQL